MKADPITAVTKVAVSFSADTWVDNQSVVFRIYIYGKNRQLRQAEKHY